MAGYVYIMASQRNGTLYIGVTNDLVRRVTEHREGKIEGFTQRYDIKMLVWYEQTERMDDAIAQEKRMKEWQRDWKIQLIEKTNPDWQDLYEEIVR